MTEYFKLTLPFEDEYSLTEYLDKNASALHNWVKMGTPKYLTKEQTETLKSESEPKIQKSKISDFNIDVSLKPHEVKMYIIEKKI